MMELTEAIRQHITWRWTEVAGGMAEHAMVSLDFTIA